MKESKIMPMSLVEQHGKVFARDLIVEVTGKTYVLTVGTPEYLEQLKRSTPQGIDVVSSILLMDEVGDIEKLKEKLIKMPVANIMSFLVEQREEK